MGIRILNYFDDWLMLAQSQVVFNVAQDPHPQPFRLPGAQGQLCQEHTVTQPTSSFLGTVIADDRNCLIGARQSQILCSAVTQFLWGARRMNPPRPRTVPPWDLPTVLRALKGSPFKPFQRFLPFQTFVRWLAGPRHSTFPRFYNLDVPALQARVLSA